MADNKALQTTPATIASGTVIASREVTYSGDASTQIFPTGIVVFSGSDDSKTATDIDPREGPVAHDGADANKPVKIGMKAIAHGTNPTAVAAADVTDWYTNRAGVPFVIGGHPNVRTAVYLWTGSTTDDTILAAISSGTKIVLTRVTITIDSATTVAVAVRLGFGTANVPALPSAGADGVEGIVCYHPGLVPGAGMNIGDGSGIIAIGGDGEELRITAGATTSGTGVVAISFYTIES